jgi:RimJ/RimL family protein N-acetyltransferase
MSGDVLTLDRITTPRLVLEPVSVAQAQLVLDGDLSRLSPAAGWPHENTAAGLHNAMRHGHAPGWFVVLDGDVIGDCGLHGNPDDNGEVEIGFGLAEPFRAQGYGSELVAAMVTWLSAQDGVKRITARTEPDNVASRRVLERAGLAEVGAADGGYLTYAIAAG